MTFVIIFRSPPELSRGSPESGDGVVSYRVRPPPSNGQATTAPVREAQPKFPRKGHNRTTFPRMESDLYRMLRGVADRTLLCMNLKFLMISGISLSSPLQSARQKSLKSGGGREDGNRWQTQCRQHGGNWSGTAPEVQRNHCRGDARTVRQNPAQVG